MESNLSLFISDLHLSESRPDLTVAFLRFLETIAPKAKHLYILGDLFNLWAGDDIQTPVTKAVANGLKKLADSGVHLYFQGGNRDFVLGKDYADRCGMTIIPEYYCLPFAPSIILLHGDQLCTQDHKYLRYRKIIRHPFVLSFLHKLPRFIRIRLVQKIRTTSQSREYYENNPKLEIPEHAVRELCDQYPVTDIIHGHTHKPDCHDYGYVKRWVLSDWDKTADYLQWDAKQGITRHKIVI